MKNIEKKRNGFNPYDLIAISKKLNMSPDQSAIKIKILDPYTLAEPQSMIKMGKPISNKLCPDIKIKL